MPPEVEWAATGPVRRGWSMKTSIAILTALAMGLTGLGAGGAYAAAPAEQDGSTKEKKVCRTSKMTGSLTRRTRICMTEADWRELNARTQRGVDEMNREAAGRQPPCAYDNPDVICH